MSGARPLKIGYLPLAHEIYWHYFPEYKTPALQLAATLKDTLSQFGTVYDTGQLIDSMARSSEARLLFQAQDVDVLVLATVTYSTPDDIILDLKRFSRPTIVWNTQASAAIPPDMNFGTWMLEHGITGVPGITNLLEREKKPYFLVSGHHTSPAVKDAFTGILQAVAAARRIWGSRIGMIGHLYPGMIDFGYDPTMMYTTFGAATVPVPEAATLAAFEAVDEQDVSALAQQLSGTYTRADDFTGQEFSQSVRLALAMQRVVTEKRLDAVTVYCQSLWQRPEMGVVPCLGMSLLMQQGVFCACEGDIPTALSGMILQDLLGQALFTEIWCNDFDHDQFMMGHSGTMNLGVFEGDPARARLVRHPWWTGCCGRGACLEVTMPPGTATLLSISQVQGSHWRLIVTVADVLERPPVPLGAPNFFIQLRKPIAEFLEQLTSASSAHHFAMAYGDWTRQLKALAKILSIEYFGV